MLSFESDYTIGAQPEILTKLSEINLDQQTAYGTDVYCTSAKEKIRAACNNPDAEIFFVSGGTQANAIVTASLLRRTEGVYAATTGHINVHESGAIEYTGHKVLTLPGYDGKISAEDLKASLEGYWADGTFEHMVMPGMVYISHPTEYGTLYTKKELEEISGVCKEYDIPLFLDGARLGYGLMSYDTDVTLEDISNLCDVFYIGGTKVGALFGEAIVFTKKNMPKHFLSFVKQQGGLLAKGWLLGVQFDTLFTDGLYFKISRNAIEMAQILKEGLKEKGYEFFIESPTNQQFVVLKNDQMKELRKKVAFSVWEPKDEDHTVVRFATSWATTKEDVLTLLSMV